MIIYPLKVVQTLNVVIQNFILLKQVTGFHISTSTSTTMLIHIKLDIEMNYVYILTMYTMK